MLLIGTFILVFVELIGTFYYEAIMINDITGELTNLGIGLSFGLVVMVVIYSIGDNHSYKSRYCCLLDL